MKERPILFSAPMVRALLDGSKTQTRRVVKPRRDRTIGCELAPHELAGEVNGGDYENAPWQPGDQLWVREAIRLVPDQEPDDGTGRVLSTYGADGSLTVADAWPWKRSYLPPMHCPRGLSRLTLEITGVRVERLQDISEADALAEGLDPMPEHDRHLKPTGRTLALNHWIPHTPAHWDRPIGAYRYLWESINGAGSWAANPWVWVVAFKRIKP